MSKTEVRRITNANVYVNGKSFLGRAEETGPPSIKYKYADHKALGMFGEMEHPVGIEKMEHKIKWNSLYPDVLKQVGNPFQAIDMQIRSSSDVYEGNTRVAQQSVVIYLKANAKEFASGTFKPQEYDGPESTFSASYYKLEINGEVITEIDVEANIWSVDGVDLMAQQRENLGI